MRASKFLPKWLGLPQSLRSMNYTREVLEYRESCNPKVSQAEIEVKTGGKWRAVEVVDAAESRLRRSALVDVTTAPCQMSCQKKVAFRDGDREKRNQVKRELKRNLKQAKEEYKNKVERKLQHNTRGVEGNEDYHWL